jgi:hypothetical protein
LPRKPLALVDLERREHEHPYGGEGLVGGDLTGGGQSVHVGHPYVHQHDVRLRVVGQRHDLLAVRGLADHLEIGGGVHEHTEARAYE